MDSALLLSPEAPYPLHGGGSIRTAALLNYLARRFHVDAVFFREPGAPDPAAAVPSRLIRHSLTIDLPAHSKAAPARIARNLSRARRGVPPLVDRFAGFEQRIAGFARRKRYAVGVAEHLWCAPYQEAVNEFCDFMILDLHNIESVLYRRRAEVARRLLRPLLERFARHSLSLERYWLPRYNLVLAASDADAAMARGIAPTARVETYPNTIPWAPRPLVEPGPRVAISANFDYDPNRAAVEWFVSRVWPRLSVRYPKLELALIGRNPEGVRDLVRGQPRILQTGPVADAVAELAASLVAAVPVVSGSGTRIKILEAWAAGVPVVSTTTGAEGLPGREGEHWLLRDEPHSFEEAIAELIESPEKRVRMGQLGRDRYEAEFTWDSGWKLLDRLGF